jgi:predicted alpha/beta-fold hydrolase
VCLLERERAAAATASNERDHTETKRKRNPDGRRLPVEEALMLSVILQASSAILQTPAAPSKSTIFPGAVTSSLISGDVRADGNRLQGVHTRAEHELSTRVLRAVPELSCWDQWYEHPPALSNGHIHTIAAAKLRKTRAVRYFRELVRTADGGTLAIDLLAGMRRRAQGDDQANGEGVPIPLLSGGALPGVSESDDFTTFVNVPPPLDASRPMLLLASGLGGGSQDTYVRSLAVTAAERGWQVAVINMRACGSSPVTSPRLFSAYRGANDDVRTAVRHLRETRLGGGGVVAAVGWSNSGTILNNVFAEQATTHADGGSAHWIDAGCTCATPLNMPANSANLQRPFHSRVYDLNLGKSLRTLWGAAREQYVDVDTGTPVPVPRWDDPSLTFVADAKLAASARSIRELDEALTRRQYGYASVDDYYAAASSDQRLSVITTPTLLLNAYDDPIVPGGSLLGAIRQARDNPHLLMAVTSHGGHLGWCERRDPWAGPAWTERVVLGFLEAALGIEKADECQTLACELFD